MKLSHLRDILAVAEHGSLRSAGRHLDIAQPAITRSIREIEQELGVALFERHAKGVRLTEMGETFIRRATAVQAELRRAREEIDQLKGKTTGEISVALSTASSIALMPSAVNSFRQRYPDAVLKISESFFPGIEADLLAGTIDFYVGPIDPGSKAPQFLVERLFDNRRVVLARKGHPYSNVHSLADLVDADWIRTALSEHAGKVDFDLAFEEVGLPKPKVVLHARSALVALLALINSDMLTMMPQQWLDFPATNGLFEVLDIREQMPTAPVCIVRRHDMPLTPIAEYLCDMMRRAAGHYVYRRESLHREVA